MIQWRSQWWWSEMVNDALALQRATVGLFLGRIFVIGGADVAIQGGSLHVLPELIELAKNRYNCSMFYFPYGWFDPCCLHIFGLALGCAGSTAQLDWLWGRCSVCYVVGWGLVGWWALKQCCFPSTSLYKWAFLKPFGIRGNSLILEKVCSGMEKSDWFLNEDPAFETVFPTGQWLFEPISIGVGDFIVRIKSYPRCIKRRKSILL